MAKTNDTLMSNESRQWFLMSKFTIILLFNQFGTKKDESKILERYKRAALVHFSPFHYEKCQ